MVSQRYDKRFGGAMSLRGFGFSLDIQTGTTRHWYLDSLGVKRWVYDDTIVDNQGGETVSLQRQVLNTNKQKEAL
jgi:hypothetical protein